MAELLNIKTGKSENLSDSEATQSLAAGTHMPVNGGHALVSPGGDLQIVPEDQLHEAVEGGYRVPDSQQLNEFANRAKYGGDANTAKAFGAGALRGASFGLSDAALPRYGAAKSETLEALKTYHPVASTTGEVAGVVGSALVAPEASPAGLVSKLGTGIAERAVPALGKVGAHAAGMAAEGAIYGAGQSVSEAALGDPDATAERLVANVGLGALLGGGLGGLFQAGKMAIPASIGKAKGATSTVYKKMIGKAPEAVEEAAAEGVPAGTAQEAAGIAAPEFQSSPLSRAMSSISGKSESDVLQDMAKGYNAEPMTQIERKKFAGETAKAFQDHYDAMKALERDTMGPARREETANLIDEMADQTKIAPEYARLVGKADEVSQIMRADPELYPVSAARELELVRDRLGKGLEIDADASTHFERLDDAKRDLFKLQKAYNGALKSTSEQRAGELIREVYGDVKSSLENPEVWGAAGARQAEVNDVYNKFRLDREIFEKKFGEKVPTRTGGKSVKMSGTKFDTHFNAINDPVRAPGREEALNNYLASSKDFLAQAEKTHETTSFENVDLSPLKEKIGNAAEQAKRGQSIVQASPGGHGFFTDLFNPTGAVIRGLKNLASPEKMGAILANMEKANQKATSRMQSAVKTVFRPVEKTTTKGLGILAEKITPSEKAARIKSKIEETQEHVRSVETLVDKLHEATKMGADVAPKTMAAVQQTATRGLQFLQSKIPPTPQTSPFEEPLDPPEQSLATFERYYQSVHDPLVILDQLKSGMVQQETVETLRNVYPQLYTELQQHVVEQLGTVKDKGKIPYQTRMTLSQFMGQPLDSSLTPQAMQMAQAAFSMPNQREQANGGGAKPNMTGMQHLNIASRAATDFQKTSLKT